MERTTQGEVTPNSHKCNECKSLLQLSWKGNSNNSLSDWRSDMTANLINLRKDLMFANWKLLDEGDTFFKIEQLM